MKYIRTKDERIIDTTKYYIENSNLFKNGAYQEYKKELANAYKQADTIEELGDRLVCFIQGEYHTYICNVSDIKYLRELEQFGGKIKTNRIYEKIYLAIWTDKGLIYKAKMKGVLPNGEIDWELL